MSAHPPLSLPRQPDPTAIRYRTERATHWDAIARRLDTWHSWGGAYHQRLTQIYQFLVAPGHRVLKPAGQLVYGAPVERRFMVFMFRRLGYDIRKAHFSTEKQITAAAGQLFSRGKILQMKSTPPLFGAVYEVGHFVEAR